jgi:hypothetical protein
MTLTVSQIYDVRFSPKLSLPKSVQDSIAKLRITPVTYKPFRPPPKHGGSYKLTYSRPTGNWRERTLAVYVSKITDKSDVDYNEVFSILNKLTSKNIGKLSVDAVETLKKRDDDFRLRVTTLLFNKAITESMYAGVMAELASILNKEFPDVSEDLSIQAKMFPQLYDTHTTLVYPSSTEADYTEKVVLWMKQKQKRRGYATFLTQLFLKNLIDEETMTTTIQDVLVEIVATAKQAKTPQTEENTTQYVDFLFESAKVLPSTSKTLKETIKVGLKNMLELPRTDLSSLCMRSRFRVEDTLKCVQ